MVESGEFIQFTCGRDSRAADSLPCANTLKTWILKFKESTDTKQITNLNEAGPFFLTVDLWSQTDLLHSYMGARANYFDFMSKRIKSAALCCREFPHPHTGEGIKKN